MFMNNFARRAGSAVFKNRRMFSGSSEQEAEKEIAKWTKLTIVMVGLSSALAVYNVVAHEHAHVRTDLPYQKIRSKGYPWSCSDCNLFDGDCWKECRANK